MSEKINIKINIRNIYVAVIFLLYFTFSYMISMPTFIFKRHVIVVALLLIMILTSVFLYFSNKHSKIDKYTIAWLVVFLISLLQNGDIQRGIYDTSLYFAVGILVPILSKKLPIEKIGFKIIAFFSLIHALFGFYFLLFPDVLLNNIGELYQLSDIYYNKLVYHIQSGYMVGITTHYSTEGMYMAFAFVIAAVSLLYVINIKGTKRTWGFLSVFYLIALFLTGKRGQLLFAAATVCLIYFLANVFGNYKRRIIKVLLFVLVLVVIFFICLNIPAFSSTFMRFTVGGDIDDFSTGRVSTLWIPALQQFVQHPLFGIGWRQFKWECPQLQINSYVNNDVHCVYLQLLCENGILLGTFVIFVMIWTLVLTIRNLLYLKRNHAFTDTYKYLMISTGFQVFFLLYSITGNPLYDIQCFYPYMFSCAVSYKIDYNMKRI